MGKYGPTGPVSTNSMADLDVLTPKVGCTNSHHHNGKDDKNDNIDDENNKGVHFICA